MLKWLLLTMLSLPLWASYNPFFQEPEKKQQPQKKQPSAPKTISQKPSMDYDIAYFGYVETGKSSYALLEVGDKSFAISNNDSFYVDNQKLEIVAIESNQVVIKNKSRYKTIYFSRKR